MNPSLPQQQEAFSSWVRTGQLTGALDHIEERRLRIYRELFFNNIESLLSRGFPVLRRVIGDVAWKKLLTDFWQKHRCQTPYFPRVGAEFFHWLQHHPLPDALPFLRELAHYELMEVVVDTADISLPELQGKAADLRSASTLFLNPVAVLLHYDYPVQMISAAFQPREPGLDKTRLLVYRDRQHQVKFMALSAASMVLLDVLQTQARSLADLVEATETSLSAVAGSLQIYIEQQVRDFIEREIIFI